jgi:hypothetical protein
MCVCVCVRVFTHMQSKHKAVNWAMTGRQFHTHKALCGYGTAWPHTATPQSGTRSNNVWLQYLKGCSEYENTRSHGWVSSVPVPWVHETVNMAFTRW